MYHCKKKPFGRYLIMLLFVPPFWIPNSKKKIPLPTRQVSWSHGHHLDLDQTQNNGTWQHSGYTTTFAFFEKWDFLRKIHELYDLTFEFIFKLFIYKIFLILSFTGRLCSVYCTNKLSLSHCFPNQLVTVIRNNFSW